MTTQALVQITPPNGWDAIKKVYGDFKYTELSGANVKIEGTWEHDHLVVLHNVSGSGLAIQLHFRVAAIFEACLTEAMRRCPNYKVRMLGGHCPRHMLHDPKNPLSIHSWGAAFDVNWDKNPVSSTLTTDLPADFIKAFTEQGWEWGGAWKNSKDAMHFQYCTGV